MKNLIVNDLTFDQSANGEWTISSLEIAKFTGKQHKDILRDIRNMEPSYQELNGRKFALVDYIDSKGETRPCYQLKKIECLFIISKYDDKIRLKLINRWEELEEMIKNQNIPSYLIEDPIARARAWADEREKELNDKLQLELEQKRLQLEYEKVVIDNCRKDLAIYDLKKLLKLSDQKAAGQFIDLQEHSDYETTTGRRKFKCDDFEYSNVTLKVLSEYFGYRLYYVDSYKFRKQLAYPIVIFELYEQMLDDYWDEISKDGKLMSIRDTELAKFILDRLRLQGREDIYFNK